MRRKQAARKDKKNFLDGEVTVILNPAFDAVLK
jgi:hypothetical protein